MEGVNTPSKAPNFFCLLITAEGNKSLPLPTDQLQVVIFGSQRKKNPPKNVID
jgi:hypothetical protein